ncbi:hypothetical protein [Streptomyces sp. NPDC090798]|uniref:hypothetical protein n=1 Tax=Streptomyces sp. NPDC090798 TaxID=3365968 RepID=UPI003811E7F6
MNSLQREEISAGRSRTTRCTRSGGAVEVTPAAVVRALTRRTGRKGREVERVFSRPPEPPLPRIRVALGPLSENTVWEAAAAIN